MSNFFTNKEISDKIKRIEKDGVITFNVPSDIRYKFFKDTHDISKKECKLYQSATDEFFEQLVNFVYEKTVDELKDSNDIKKVIVKSADSAMSSKLTVFPKKEITIPPKEKGGESSRRMKFGHLVANIKLKHRFKDNESIKSYQNEIEKLING